MAPSAHIGQSRPYRDRELGAMCAQVRGVCCWAWGLQIVLRKQPRIDLQYLHISHVEIALVRGSVIVNSL
jgi:hypothetical protein